MFIANATITNSYIQVVLHITYSVEVDQKHQAECQKNVM